MIKPITMKKALQVLKGTEEMSPVDVFIQHVNSRFATKVEMLRHRCDPRIGHFYSVALDQVATPAECLAIEAAFKPHWLGVKVVYWQGRLSVQLDCAENRDWTSFYNGKPLVNGVVQDDAQPRKAA